MNNKNNPNRTRYNHNQGHNKNRSRQRFTPERLSINKVYDSNGPTGRQRGNASTLYEKYTTLARDAHSAGDRVLSENFMQYAEHYLRIINSIQEQMQSVYQDSPRESDTSDEQSYNETSQADIYPEPHYDTQRHNQTQTRSDMPVAHVAHFEQPEHSIRDDISQEKPTQRRKMYPYARRKPYDPNYQQTQNLNQTHNLNNNSDTVPQPAFLNNQVLPDANTKNATIVSPTPQVESTDNNTEVVKPRRVVRRRIVTPEGQKNQADI